jgi:sirohydrochlorin cobaltochelatase
MSIIRSIRPPEPVREADRRTGLLIVGHGSGRSSGPFTSASSHAGRLLDSGRFGEARVAFLMAGPDPRETLDSMRAPTVHIVPLFMCDGYYTRTVIPKALSLQGPRTFRDGSLLVYGPPIGMHPRMADILLQRAVETCRAAGWEPSEAHLMVIGHGSPKSPASAEATRRHASEVRRLSDFLTVGCAFIDEAPRIEDWLRDLPADGPPVVLVGFFAADGLHSSLDMPGWIDAWERRTGNEPGTRLRYTGAVGADERVTALIAESIETEAEGAEISAPTP